MPDFLFENAFISNVLKVLNTNGFVIFNTIVSDNSAQIRNEKFVKLIESKNIKLHVQGIRSIYHARQRA